MTLIQKKPPLLSGIVLEHWINTGVIVPKDHFEMLHSALTSPSPAGCSMSHSMVLSSFDWVHLERQIPPGKMTQKMDAATHLLSHLPSVHEQAHTDQQWHDLALPMVKMFQNS